MTCFKQKLSHAILPSIGLSLMSLTLISLTTAATAQIPNPGMPPDALHSALLEPTSGQYPANHGPRAGFIRDSGDLVTELVAREALKFELFILDTRWVDKRAKDYTVKLSLDPAGGKAAKPAPCKPSDESFICEIPQALKAGDALQFEIAQIESTSKAPNNKKVYKITYKFPFAYSEEAESKSTKKK